MHDHHPRSAPSPAVPVPAAAWLLLAFLTGLNVLNFVVRQVIPGVAPLLIADLGLTRAQIGFLIGFAFVVVYSVAGVLLGVVADRWPRRLLIGGGLAAWSAMALVSGAARNFVQLAIPRVVSGLGQAALTPAAIAMIGDVFPARRVGFASGVYYAGLPIGTALSLWLAGWLAPRHGWRACFYLSGGVGLAVLLLLAFMREPPRRAEPRVPPDGRAGNGSHDTARDQPDAALSVGRIAGDAWTALRGRPALLLVMLGGAMLTYGSAAATHGVTWLVEERRFSYSDAASLSALMAVTAGLLGNLAGGWLSDWFARRWHGGRSWSLAALAVSSVPFGAGFLLLPPGSMPFFACWFLSSATGVAHFGPVVSAVQELSPVRIRASLVATCLLVLNLVGVGPGSLITGVIGDRASLTLGLLVSVGVGGAGVVAFALAGRLTPRVPRNLSSE